MSVQPIVRFVGQIPGHGDCGVSSFAMCLGITYPQALVALSAVAPKILDEAVSSSEMRRAARRMGVTLRLRTRGVDVDDEETEGILIVRFVADAAKHAVYLKRSLIFDGRTDAVWDADVYLRIHNCDVEGLLVRVA